MAYSDAEPITKVNILHTDISRLITDLAVENILPGVLPFLSRDEQEKIEGARTQSERSLILIDCLDRRTTCQSYEAFNAFMKILGGTQPELFTALVGRSPTPSEVDSCVKKYSIELKKNITETGHKTDSLLDEEIDFDTQYIQLKLIPSTPCVKSFAKTDTEDLYLSGHGVSLPHQYQKHISEVKEGGANIPVCNVLNVGKVQAKRVLLSGRAGVGKTTTLQWLAQQWASDGWATQFTLLFLIQLRMLSNTHTNNISAIELLTLYGLFQLTAEGSQQVLYSWLKIAADRVVILMDGLDEIAEFSEKVKNCPKITDLNQKAHPIDLCINIIRGDLLPGRTIIYMSRPFTGLSTLNTDTAFEILGLTQKQVKEYVEKRHHTRAEYVMSVLYRNPLLMSVCGITFYCMAVSTLLSEGVEMFDEEIKTYTRLTAFIIVQYVTRKLPDWPFVIQVRSYFPKLAHLAEIGIFQSKQNQGLSRLVFNEYDLCEVGLTPSDLESVKKGGILNIKEVKAGKRNYIYAEFLHLTTQEMLAVAHLLSKPLPTEEVLRDVFSSNQFNMARMYLFGFQHDKESHWIKDVCRAVSPSGLCADGDNSAHISEFLKSLCTGQENKLRVCQLVHESQMEDLARLVVDYVAPDGVLTIEHTPMTAIDVGAIAFVCACPHALNQITTRWVNADDTVIEVMSSTLIQPHITSLQSLNISYSMTAEGAQTLSKIIQHSTCLETLDVSFNQIGDNGALALGEVLHTNNSLQVLDVTFNAIGDDGAKALAEALHVNTSLKTLHLMGNNIGVEGAVSFSEALVYNQTLQELNVSNNHIGANGARALAEVLHTNNSLHELEVSPNEIGVDGVKALAEALHVNKTLKTLHLLSNEIGWDGAVSLSEALVHNQTLQELDVSWNHIGVSGARALAEALHTNNSLRVLDVSHNDIGDDGAKALAEALHTNNSLQVLDVSGNDIGDDSAKALAETLHINNSLQVLDVSDNDIGDNGAKALAETLHINNSLQVLDVSDNDTGDDGAKALAEALHTNNSLQVLNVSHNDIWDDGAKALAEALHTNNSLQVLNVSHNDIWDDGAKALAEALHTNNSLQELNVSCNAIGDDGAKALAEALHTNNSLQELNVSCNAIGDDGAKALAETLHTNSSLKVLDVSDTGLCVDGAKALAEALHTNNSLQELNVLLNTIGDDGAKALTEALHTNNSLRVLNMSKNWG